MKKIRDKSDSKVMSLDFKLFIKAKKIFKMDKN